MATTTNGARPPVTWPLKNLPGLTDYLQASHARAIGALVALALIAFLPGFFQIPPVDRDEARFAQATKQMVETGDYIDIRFQDEVRYKKPVGIYWLQAAAVKAGDALGISNAHTTIWLYRLPSLAGAIGAVLLTYWAALAFISRRGALLAGAMMASSILLGVEARLAKTDAVLLLTVVAAMGAMARIYLGQRRSPGLDQGWRLPAIFWTALAAGILIKGPLIVLFVGLAGVTLAIADRSLSWIKALRPMPGVIWTILLVLPWFIAIVVRAGDSFFAESLGQDMFAKVASSQETHGAPPGYYLLLFWMTFWPGAMIAGLAAPAVWNSRREPGARFLLAWLVPAWIVFEIVVTKLPHYVLPLYPAIAILSAGMLDARLLTDKRWIVWIIIGWFTFPAIVALGSITGIIIVERQLGLLAWPFAGAAVILGLFAWRLYDVDGAEASLMRAIGASALVAIAVYGVVFPSMPSIFLSVALRDAVHDAECKKPVIAAAGFQEPSLVFLLGTETRLIDGVDAAAFLRQGPCRYALMDSRNERSFVQRADALGLRYSPGPRIEGYNISNGRPVTIAIYRSEGEK